MKMKDISEAKVQRRLRAQPSVAVLWPSFRHGGRDADGSSLARTSIAGKFDLSTAEVSEHLRLGPDEVGLEIRFLWRGKMRHELHRWPLKYPEQPNGRRCEAGRELLPVLRFDDEL